jgi:phage-related protein
MSNKTLGIILIVVGVVVVAFMFLTPVLHIVLSGWGPTSKKFIAVIVVGVIAFVAGLFLTFGKGGTPKKM